jgi:hypothetical protein
MNIETKFNCGDKGWTFNGAHVVQRTIGQIRTLYTESQGIGDGFMEGGVIESSGDEYAINYAPKAPELVEEYMCVETGIGSGQVYTFGKTMFLTEEECRTACAEAIARREAKVAEQKAYEREQTLKEESYLRTKLARIEAMKAETA